MGVLVRKKAPNRFGKLLRIGVESDQGQYHEDGSTDDAESGLVENDALMHTESH